MKKCVKKIPKYGNGISGASVPSPQESFKAMNSRVGGPLTTVSNTGNIAENIMGAVGAGAGAIGQAFGIELGKNAQIANGVASMLETVPVIGDMLGAPVRLWGGLAGEGGRVNRYTGEKIKASGMTRWLGLGRDDKSLALESNRIKTANISKTLSENLKTDYYNNTPGAGSINVLAAEGGIMRQPVLAKVSPGELRIDPITLKYEEIPGDGGKPNDDDNVTKILGEGEIIASNAAHMKMPNGKTPADNAKTILDSNMSEQLKKKMIKKLTNWQEANKTKPQEYGTLHAAEGWDGIIESWDDYLKKNYTLSKDNTAQELNDFWGYDSKAGKYTDDWDKIIRYIGNNKDLKAKAIKDLSGLSYIGNGANAWDNIVKAAHDKNVRDVHRYFRQVGDDLVHNLSLIDYTPSHGVVINRIQEPFINKRKTKTNLSGATLINSYRNTGANKKLTKVTPEQLNASALHYSNLKWPEEKRSNKFGDALDSLTDLALLAAPMVGDYGYETVIPRIARNHNIPVDYSINDILTDNQIANAINNYNVSQMGGGTGAYLAAANQSAANLMKANSLARIYQKNKQNELIGKNIAQLNDWERYANNQMLAADIATDQNQGMAQQMKDLAKKDALEFYYGKRNGNMLTAMMEPMFEYGTPYEAYRRIYKRRAV